VKVLQLVPEFPPPLHTGGGYHVHNLTRELVKRGIDVTVFTLDMESPFCVGRARTEIHFGRVKVFRIPAFYIPKTIYPVGPHLLPLLLRERADIIHAHGYQFFTSDLASIISRIKKTPLVLTLHGFPADSKSLTHRLFFRFIGKRELGTAGKIISVSNAVTQEFQAVGVDGNKIVTIPNGINLEEFRNMPDAKHCRRRFGLKENERLILAIGRLEKAKGFQYLIRALQLVEKRVGAVKLLIAGPEFTYGPELRNFVKQMGFEKSVIFYGAIGGREKLEAFAAADIVAIPSLYEGFGILLLEAMAAGKPVVATRTGVATELIQDGKNGFLVNLGDVEDLANKIAYLLSHDDLMSSIGSESRKTVEAFDWGKIAAQIVKTYIDCLKS